MNVIRPPSSVHRFKVDTQSTAAGVSGKVERIYVMHLLSPVEVSIRRGKGAGEKSTGTFSVTVNDKVYSVKVRANETAQGIANALAREIETESKGKLQVYLPPKGEIKDERKGALAIFGKNITTPGAPPKPEKEPTRPPPRHHPIVNRIHRGTSGSGRS